MRISDWNSDVCSSDLRLTWLVVVQPAALLSVRLCLILYRTISIFPLLTSLVSCAFGEFGDTLEQQQRKWRQKRRIWCARSSCLLPLSRRSCSSCSPSRSSLHPSALRRRRLDQGKHTSGN